MSPRRLVVKCGDDCYAVQVFWDPDEWCSELPDWWVEIAGCSRCVRVTLLATLAHHGHETAREIVDHLYQQGFHIADDGRWVVVLEDERACIAPWPKHVHKKLV